jgi:hypothetical protein
MVTNDDNINKLFREGFCNIPDDTIRLKQLPRIVPRMKKRCHAPSFSEGVDEPSDDNSSVWLLLRFVVYRLEEVSWSSM